MKRIWGSHPSCVQLELEGEVNGHVTPDLLDSGAAISVVPENLVAPSQMTGDCVAVRRFGAKKPMLLPTAELTFKIGGLEWVEGVAVSPRQEGVEEEVIYSLDLQSKRGWELVLFVNKVDHKEVLRVTTRAQSKKERQKQEEEELAAEMEVPRAKPLSRGVTSRKDEPSEPEAAVDVVLVEEETGRRRGLRSLSRMSYVVERRSLRRSLMKKKSRYISLGQIHLT